MAHFVVQTQHTSVASIMATLPQNIQAMMYCILIWAWMHLRINAILEFCLQQQAAALPST
jgi:hypothetical protein